MTPTENTSDYKSPSRKGDISEIDICLHFLNMGYEVFKNMGCSGRVDFIILDKETGEVFLYDANEYTVDENGTVIRNNVYKVSKNEDSSATS